MILAMSEAEIKNMDVQVTVCSRQRSNEELNIIERKG
jgi:hypothetical protein